MTGLGVSSRPPPPRLHGLVNNFSLHDLMKPLENVSHRPTPSFLLIIVIRQHDSWYRGQGFSAHLRQRIIATGLAASDSMKLGENGAPWK